MSHTAVRLSRGFLERDREIEDARREILRFCDDLDLFRYALRPEQPRRASVGAIHETATIEELLGILTNEWDPECHPHQESADPDRRRATELKHALLILAEAFDIFLVPKALLSANEPALWRHFDEEWHNQAGCASYCGAYDVPIGERRVAEHRIAENRIRLGALRQVVGDMPAYRWRGVIARFALSGSRPWALEARALADHGLQTWMPEAYSPDRDPTLAMIAQESALLPARLGWRPDEAALLTLALNDLTRAVITQGIVAPLITGALMEPFSHIIDLSQVA